MRLAHISNLIPTTASDVPRATTENYALDSYQNLIFSIARFHEYTGRWPTRITVVGYEMKRRRFTELHRAALRWPVDRFEYVGIDAEGDKDAAQQGEVCIASHTPECSPAFANSDCSASHSSCRTDTCRTPRTRTAATACCSRSGARATRSCATIRTTRLPQSLAPS